MPERPQGRKAAGAAHPLGDRSMLEHPAKYRFSLKEIPPHQRRDVAAEVARHAWPLGAAGLPWSRRAGALKAAVVPDTARASAGLHFTAPAGGLEMELESCVMPGVTVTDAWVCAHRTQSAHQGMNGDDFTLIWPAGPAQGAITQRGKELMATGEATLVSCAERIACETREAFRHMSVKLERQALLALLPDAEDALMRPIAASNEALRLLNAYIAGLRVLDSSRCTPEFARRVAMHIVDLVALAAGAKGDAGQMAVGRGLRAAQLAAVKSWALARLDSPRLNVNTAAAAAGLSARSVQLLFESEGLTFTSYVQRQRLALAHRRLSAPCPARGNITDIAYDCGFGNLSHFSRSFREIYGESPSEVRRRCA
jgi:AraC-like DNA-binding protein